MSSSSFKIYRFQLLPIDRNSTKDLYNEFTTEDLIKQKNDIFGKVIFELDRKINKKRSVIIEIKNSSSNTYLISIAPSRPLTRETIESKIESVENWPHTHVIIFNLPDEQLILVQDRQSAFANTDTVINLFISMTKAYLDKVGLSLHVEALFRQEYFWNLVECYKNKISTLEFEFITPNMANISKSLSTTLKHLAKDTNAVNQELKLKADPISSLDVSSKNETLKGLVDYASSGGGDVAIKVKGIRKKFHTSKEKKEIQLSDIEIFGDRDAIRVLLQEVLK